jgi:hypothetical protein
VQEILHHNKTFPLSVLMFWHRCTSTMFALWSLWISGGICGRDDPVIECISEKAFELAQHMRAHRPPSGRTSQFFFYNLDSHLIMPA